MDSVYETITCKGCGSSIAIRRLEWAGDRKAYALNASFNADVPCERCEETYSYRPEDIHVVEAAHA